MVNVKFMESCFIYLFARSLLGRFIFSPWNFYRKIFEFVGARRLSFTLGLMCVLFRNCFCKFGVLAERQ